MNLAPFSLRAVLKFLDVAKAVPANFALPKDENDNKSFLLFSEPHFTALCSIENNWILFRSFADGLGF